MLTTLKPETYAVYGRISMDKDNDQAGVRRQVGLGHQLAEQRGYVRAEVPGSPGWGRAELVDNDISASKGKRRDSYERLLNYVLAEKIDVIVLYMSSRLWRNRKERAIAFERLAQSKVKIVAVRGQEIDLSTAAGRMIAGILGEVDAHETEQMGERKRDAMAQQARLGHYIGPTPFGYTKIYASVPLPDGSMGRRYTGGLEVVPDLRDEIRGAAEHLLNGGSLRGVALDWNFRGIRTARGGRWSLQQLRQILLAPYMVGLRGGGPGGNGRSAVYQRWSPTDAGTYKGGWEAVLDLETREALQSLLTSPERRTSPVGRGAKHLLTGIATCGHCGHGVCAASYRDRRGGTRRYYECPGPPTGCGKCARKADAVDAWVFAHIAHWLVPNGAYDAALATAALASTPEMAVVFAEQSRDRLARERLDDRLADGEFDDEDGRTDLDGYRRQCRRLDLRMTERKRQIDQLGLATALEAVPERGAGFLATWKALSASPAGVQKQREIVRAMVAEVVFEPGRRGGQKVDLSKIRVKPAALLTDVSPDLLALPAA